MKRRLESLLHFLSGTIQFKLTVILLEQEKRTRQQEGALV
jgi:hypothetical protein